MTQTQASQQSSQQSSQQAMQTTGQQNAGTTQGTSTSTPTNDTPAPVSNSAFARAIEEGGFLLNLGRGLSLSAEDIGPGSGTVNVDLGERSQVLPGVHLRQLRYNRRNSTATVTGDVSVPHLRTPSNGLRMTVNNLGEVTLDATLVSDLPLFKNKRVQVGLDASQNLSAILTVEPDDLSPARRIGNLSVTGGGSLQLADGKFSGNVEADLSYEKLGSGHVSFRMNNEGRASGSGDFSFEQEYLNGASASMEVDEDGNLATEVVIPVADLQSPISGLNLTEGSLRFTMDNATPGGGLEGVKFEYNGLGEAVISANIRNGQFSGSGSFAVTLAELTDVSGRLRYADGALSGSMTIQPRHFPNALRVRSGSITVDLLATGDIEFSGQASIDLGPAGTGELRAAKENGSVSIGATVTLENIPGLQSAQFSITFTDTGTIEGEGEVATDDSYIPGLSGKVQVAYKDNLWSGETEIQYSRENPSVSGAVTVRVRQTEEGGLEMSGEGELTAQIIPGVEGMAGVVVDEEGNVVLNFAITQTDPYELFPEKRMEKEFLNISQNIPLWAGIVVAVIRIRAGARAGVGPGQIRNSRIEGTWNITSDAPPELTVGTEFFMPAFVEGYVAFGAGLGVDVLLGSLTGGIEAMATAGLYGAVSVEPELHYQDGDWLFDGTVTMAAGARLKLSLNAWAEIEALWVTVWERTWELASHTMNIGPDLVLSANVLMNLSNPQPPEITYEASDTDNRGLIDSAMPEDGPPSAGTREAVANRAQWQGNTRGQGQDADRVPGDLASQANEAPPAPDAPARPPRRSPPPSAASAEAGNTANENGSPAGNNPQRGNAGQTPASTNSSSGGRNTQTSDASPNANASTNTNAAATGDRRQGAVPESEIPNSDQPRYPNAITLDTLNEPPAPTPRTAEQQREDLRMAQRVFSLVEAQVQDSEQLATYFPKIQRRFQLTSIGYQTISGATVVVLAINPTVTIRTSELVKGRGIAGKQTNITYTSGTIDGSSDTVGLEMIADPLGPDHPAGSGPSGQSDLMGRLVTDPKQPSDKKYIRGHLLNDRVGGEGAPRNLFPITGAANRAHEQQIESRIKTWVNSDRYWVYYKVSTQVNAVDISDKSKKSTNKVNAKFVCEASVYDLQNVKHNTIRATIVSIYSPPANTATVENTSGPSRENEVSVETRDEDLQAEIERSDREGDREYILNEDVYDALRRVRAKRKSWEKIDEQLAGVSGLGRSRLDTLRLAYDLSKGATQLPEIGDNLPNATARANLTRINGQAAAIVSKLAPWF